MEAGPIAAWVLAVLSFAGLIFAIFQRLTQRIADIETARKAALADIYEKIDDVKERYVRRDDLQEHLARIERGQARIEGAVAKVGSDFDEIKGELIRGLNNLIDRDAKAPR